MKRPGCAWLTGARCCRGLWGGRFAARRKQCNEVMQMLWKRISDRPNWRHVYKVRRLR